MADWVNDIEKIRIHHELFSEWTGDDVIEFNLSNPTKLEQLYFDKALELNDLPDDAIEWVVRRMKQYYDEEVELTEENANDDDALTAVGG